MIKKFIVLIFTTLIITSISGQTDLSGKYWTMSCGFTHGYFLRLFPDSIAHYTPIYEYADSYSKGTWRQSNDTLIVTIIDTTDNSISYEYFQIQDSLQLNKINKAPYVLSNKLYRQEAYFSNGDIKYKIEYGFDKDLDYQFDGRIYYYYPQKKIKQIIDYKNGLKDGIEINFKWYGYASSCGTWRKGQKHGDWDYYDSDFNLVSHAKYKNGKLKHGDEKGSTCFPSWDMEILKKLYIDKE
ncbi:MAG: hypothetical protein JXB49_37805 [Bacteroidales bacterium]|nr:hypothetical protein [Bacteroidales bacterium]MBN2747528.1 hypothetical protein [Bacteroidales bacterium]